MILMVAFWASRPALAEAIPDPLRLDQALTYAEDHPRVALGSRASAHPRRQPLYLDCHRLAYSHLNGDDQRSRPADGLLRPLAAQQLEILERYLDVLLADLSYARYNEAMAVAYIQYDRANVRRELGQYSEVLVAKRETAYQDLLRKRTASEASQRLTRALLAQAMGRPGELPRELRPPDLTDPPTPLPELADLFPDILAQAVTRTADGMGHPEERRLLEMELRQQTLELLLRLQVLEATARYAQIESIMRDLNLDESRTLYEQEVKADLGFSMSQQTKARLQEARVTYCRVLAWAELDALQGKPIWTQTHAETLP